jgi:tetratricopeptide (TPR) repeat protein
MTQVSLQDALKIAWQQQQAGRLVDAEQIYRQVLASDPTNLDALYGLGLLALRAQHAGAVEILSRVAAARPNDAQVLVNLGLAFTAAGRIDEAMACNQKAIALTPNFPDPHYYLGNALQSRGRVEEAIACFARAVEIWPQFPEAHNNLGVALRALGRPRDAIPHYQKAIELRPNYPEAHNNLGVVLREVGRLPEAIAYYRRAIALRPNYGEVQCNLGAALRDMGEFDAAMQAARKAVEMLPNLPETHDGLAAVYATIGEFDKAIACCRKAIAIRPDYARAHLNLAMILMLRGNFEQGAREYEWRWKVHEAKGTQRPITQPQWDGSAPVDAQHSTILLYPEQGMGDALQFARYIPLVIRRGWRVILDCPTPLLRIMNAADGLGATVIESRTDGNVPRVPFDVHLPMASLPLQLGELDPFHSALTPGPYLRPEPEAAAHWRAVIGPPGADLKVGLSWAGSPTHKNDRNRSITLAALAPLVQPGVQFYSLQLGSGSDQAKAPPRGMNLIDHTRHLKDFADTAAMIAELDLVISIDTALVHLAGAMGKPTWVLLASTPDFRWLLDREDTPLYPSMRLFRQDRPGNWATPIKRIAQELAKTVAALPQP